MSAGELGDAEGLSRILKKLELDFVGAGIRLLANYKKPLEIDYVYAIAEYECHRRKVGISESQISNVVRAVNRFAAHVGRPQVGNPTKGEVEGFLATLPEDVSACTSWRPQVSRALDKLLWKIQAHEA